MSDGIRKGSPVPPNLEVSTLSLKQRFDILKNARRRYVLEYLREHRAPADIGTLSEYVAARETGLPPEELSHQQRKRAYVALYQCHLPRMDEANVVRMDTAQGVVATGIAAPPLYRYLSPEHTVENGWYRYYLGIVAVGLVLLLAVSLLGGTNESVTNAVVGALVVSLSTCSVSHVLAQSEAVSVDELDIPPLSQRPEA